MNARTELAGFATAAPARAALTALSKSSKTPASKNAHRTPQDPRIADQRWLNGGAFRLQYHLNATRGLTLSPAKLDLAAVWREEGIFTAREKEALASTEALTHRTQRGISDEDYKNSTAEFSRKGSHISDGGHRHHQRMESPRSCSRATSPLPQHSFHE